MMNKCRNPECRNPECSELSVQLKNYCWNHLRSEERLSYGNELAAKLRDNLVIENGNFKYVQLSEINFPNFVKLLKCDFSHANLLKCSFQRGDFRGSVFDYAVVKDCNFEYSDFRGTDTSLQHADLRETHFDGASLQNANLTDSDLRDAILINADMIGAMLQDTKLYASRLMNTRIRKENFCNFEPIKYKYIRTKDENYINGVVNSPLEAKYVYSSLKNNFKSIGEYEDERWAHIKARKMERLRLYNLGFMGDRNSDALALERWAPEDKDKLFESRSSARWKYRLETFQWFFGYGERPLVFLIFSAITVFLCSFLYLFLGFEYTLSGGNNIIINRDLIFTGGEVMETFNDFLTSFYVSVVTFSTLGYGDARPIGYTRIIACGEALLGLVFLSSYVATFLRKLMRE